MRNRLKPDALLGNIKLTVLQIGIQEWDRDALRFFWVKDLTSFEVVKLRFTRVPFGCTSSPFHSWWYPQHLDWIKIEGKEENDIVSEIQKNT